MRTQCASPGPVGGAAVDVGIGPSGETYVTLVTSGGSGRTSLRILQLYERHETSDTFVLFVDEIITIACCF